MKLFKRSVAFALALVLVASMAGCSAVGSLFGKEKFDANAYVTGLIDAIYLNQQDEAYMKMLSEEVTEDDLKQQYQNGLKSEAEFFMSYCSISGVSEQTVQRVIDLYDGLYAHTKYEIGELSQSEEGYTVSVTVYPIDVMVKAISENGKSIEAAFQKKLDAGKFNDYTDEAFEEAWADMVLDAVEKQAQTVGYLDPVTIDVKVQKDSSGMYTVNDADWQKIDESIILYQY